MRPGIEDYFARSCYAAPDRILVATALTDLEYLAPQAVTQAEAAQAELVFVHAIAPDAPPAKATFYNPLKADRDARLSLEVLARHIRVRNIPCSTLVRHGEPSQVIEDVLREKSAGRLIIGTRASADAVTGSMGSVAGQLLLQTPVPVCTLPFKGPDASIASTPLRRQQSGLGLGRIETPAAILYPIGEHGPHPEGIRFALDLAQYLHTELILLQISAPGHHSADPLATTCSTGLWPRVRHISGTDASAGALLRSVYETGAGMLMIEAPPSLGGSMTASATLVELVAQAPCPVLMLPVLPSSRNHPDFHILSGTHSDSVSHSIFGTH